MRIVQALSWYFPESLGGTEVYVAALANRFARKGHAVSIAAPMAGAAESRNYIHEGIPVFRFPIPDELTRQEAQGVVPLRGAPHFANYLENAGADIVHFHTFGPGLGLREVGAAKRSGARVVATNHLPSLGYLCQRGTLMRWGTTPCDGVVEIAKCAACELQHRGLPKAVASAVAWLSLPLVGKDLPIAEGRVKTALLMGDLIDRNRSKQNDLISLLDRFVLLNKSALDILVANGANPNKLTLNYLGVSHVSPDAVNRMPEVRAPGSVRFGFLGRFAPMKGVIELSKAVRSIGRDKDFSIEFRGPQNDEESRKTVRAMKRILDGDRRVRIERELAPRDVPDFLAGIDILCVPSACFEGGPTVVGEAFAAGTPVIGTRIGAMPELISDHLNGRLVPPGDWRQFASVMEQLIRNPALVDSWKARLPAVRTMDSVAADYLSMYQTILVDAPAG